jgi:hypothetical protein
MVQDYQILKSKGDRVVSDDNIPGEAKIPRNRRDAVETFKDLTKLIITLSTGIFVLSPAFLGVLKFSEVKFLSILFFSWAAQLASITLGLLVFSSLAGTQNASRYDIDNKYTKWLSRFQWAAFWIGILLFGIFAGSNLH